MSQLPPTKLFGDTIDELITKVVSEPVYVSNDTRSGDHEGNSIPYVSLAGMISSLRNLALATNSSAKALHCQRRA
jgi:hypothetical protein